jgi:hypothetical protein
VTPRLIAVALIGALVALGSLSAAPSVPAGYTIYQTVALDPQQSGIAGALEILQDERVTAAYRDGWGHSREPDTVLDEGDPLLREIAQHPLRNGRLRFVDAHGKIVYEEQFEVPLAKIDKALLYGTKFPTYLIGADYGIGMGSYAGPATVFAEVRQGKLAFMRTAEASRKNNRIWLLESLKNSWKIVSSATGIGKDILLVQCHTADFDNPKAADADQFVVVYTRYSFDGKEWHQASRKETGFWEADGDFPAGSKFP